MTQDKTIRYKTRHDNIRQYNIRPDKARQDKTTLNNITQYKARHDKTM